MNFSAVICISSGFTELIFSYTASEVLAHPWVTGRGTDNVLETPANLRRNTLSATNLGNFAAKANEHYRYLNSGLNGLSEALDNLNLAQQLELEGNYIFLFFFANFATSLSLWF